MASVSSSGRAIDCVLNLDAIMFQSPASCTVEFHARLLVCGQGIDEVQLGQRQVAVRPQRLKAGSRAELLLLLRDLEQMLCQVAGLAGCANAGCALFQRITSVA